MVTICFVSSCFSPNSSYQDEYCHYLKLSLFIYKITEKKGDFEEEKKRDEVDGKGVVGNEESVRRKIVNLSECLSENLSEMRFVRKLGFRPGVNVINLFFFFVTVALD